MAPTDRSSAGYRLYTIDAVARLDLVRTLRDLGLDLSTIRRVVDRELSLPEVADFMHKAAQLSEDERQRVIADFLESAFGGLGTRSTFAGVRRSMTPEIPDNAEVEQVRAWAERAVEALTGWAFDALESGCWSVWNSCTKWTTRPKSIRLLLRTG